MSAPSLRFYLELCVCAHAGDCLSGHVSSVAPAVGSQRHWILFRAGVTGSCELLNVDAGDQTRVL